MKKIFLYMLALGMFLTFSVTGISAQENLEEEIVIQDDIFEYETDYSKNEYTVIVNETMNIQKMDVIHNITGEVVETIEFIDEPNTRSMVKNGTVRRTKYLSSRFSAVHEIHYTYQGGLSNKSNVKVTGGYAYLVGPSSLTYSKTPYKQQHISGGYFHGSFSMALNGSLGWGVSAGIKAEVAGFLSISGSTSLTGTLYYHGNVSDSWKVRVNTPNQCVGNICLQSLGYDE